MKIGDLVMVSPFIPKDPANQKGKVGEIVEIVNNNGFEIVKVKFSNECYGLYDGEVLQLIKNDKKQKQ
ncbi:hypothetical protein [Capnocytophaga granulosa]|uniref:hypothetical protein n=1 Tax=Capnocytophaga granulosa TaxID=45242 RepID=UPI0028E9772A|nr:hypothetical protein [Capnocytophaga granulosa]